MLIPKGPFCQSCGMPMEKPEIFGKNADGSKNRDYCHYCYEKGKFTEPNITLKQMIDKVSGFLAKEMNMPKSEANEIANTFIPQLKRWKKG